MILTLEERLKNLEYSSKEELSIDVQRVENERSWINYIITEDFDCIYKGVRTKLLSFAYQAFHWAKYTKSFSMKDSFVLNHLNYSWQLENLHFEYLSDRG
ncbi:hypothetical protein R5R35_000353 [Gryllus longicercus]|uniref:Uncharacterized protein n=1 Tax=Gryllus longicercus TaxID=2509291 RepID=A0AAN9WMA3_9ORTH